MNTVEIIEIEDGELGFQIPQEIIDCLKITPETEVFMDVTDGVLIVNFRN